MIKTKCAQNTAKWHDWYAWYPVMISAWHEGDRICYQRAWRETIQRKKYYNYAGDWWEYRLKA